MNPPGGARKKISAGCSSQHCRELSQAYQMNGPNMLFFEAMKTAPGSFFGERTREKNQLPKNDSVIKLFLTIGRGTSAID